MYAMHDWREQEYVENCCYDQEHVDSVTASIKSNFDNYFERFIESCAGSEITCEQFKALGKSFGSTNTGGQWHTNQPEMFKAIIRNAIDDFEKNRREYQDILDKDSLEEAEDDPEAFKTRTLRDECPIIRYTYYNRQARELQKYRMAFNCSDPQDLLRVVTNLSIFGENYVSEYDPEAYENIENYNELGMGEMDVDDYYTVYGVIGGGIKTHMMYKVYPHLFPNRSRNAIWALWYLTEQKTFNCRQESEFLMIDLEQNTTQQNYYYPYELFAWYAFVIYKLLQKKADTMNVHINPDYRYVVVDAFLDYVAYEHEEEINFLKEEHQE